MTTDTPDTTTPASRADIIVPAAVQAIFDRADADGECAAKILGDAVQLTSKDGKTVYETVKWEQAWQWAKAAISVIARSGGTLG